MSDEKAGERDGAVPRRRPEEVRAERARRRRLDTAFEGALPEGTTDERGDAWGESDPGGRDDEWFRSQVPPHHGG